MVFKLRKIVKMIVKIKISIALLHVVVMLVAYLNAHVTLLIAWIDVHAIRTVTVDVHVLTKLIIVAILVMLRMKTITSSVEINNEFSYYFAKKIADFSIQHVNTNVSKATKTT